MPDPDPDFAPRGCDQGSCWGGGAKAALALPTAPRGRRTLGNGSSSALRTQGALGSTQHHPPHPAPPYPPLAGLPHVLQLLVLVLQLLLVDLLHPLYLQLQPLVELKDPKTNALAVAHNSGGMRMVLVWA